jgi:hypothetical protein
MRPSSLWIIALVFGFDNLSAQTPATAPGTVDGHVYCADTHTPCRFASVTIQTAPPAKEIGPDTANSPSHSYAASTSLEGAFHISGVAPGDYYILGRQSGYLSPYDIAHSEFPDDPSLSSKALDIALTRITVRSGLTTATNLTLSRGASLAGTIRYDDGGLAITAAVHLFRKDASGKWKPYLNTVGDSLLASLFPSHTDDRGYFYEPGLPAGIYCVETTLPEATGIPQTITGRPSLSIAITTGDALRVFNGDKYRLRDAPSIELHEGEDRSGIDIDIPTSGLHSLRGSITAKSDGRSVTHGKVRLLDPDDKTTLRETSIQDGSFVFNYVVNGSYLVQIEAQADGPDGKPGLSYEPLLTPLLVEGDLSDLTYALTPAKH